MIAIIGAHRQPAQRDFQIGERHGRKRICGLNREFQVANLGDSPSLAPRFPTDVSSKSAINSRFDLKTTSLTLATDSLPVQHGSHEPHTGLVQHLAHATCVWLPYSFRIDHQQHPIQLFCQPQRRVCAARRGQIEHH